MSQNESVQIAELKSLLVQEREILRKGAFAEMPALAQRKQELIGALEGTPGSALADVRAQALRNQTLLDAALRGVRNARGRLQQIEEGARGFTGYDRNGQARRISRGEGTVEIRA